MNMQERNIMIHDGIKVNAIPMWVRIRACFDSKYWYNKYINRLFRVFPYQDKLVTYPFSGVAHLIERYDCEILMYLN